jgi:geranylgeranyl pyrophosphate synthase
MMRERRNANILKPILPAACAIEMVHTASLIHDDLPSIDNSYLRRGNLSTHVKFGEATAILAGDALITKAFEVLTDIKDREKAVTCVNVLARAISTRGVLGGQTVDVTVTGVRARINVLKYIHMKKTGSLLQAAMDLACVLYGAEENVTLALQAYANNVGLAYQIIDDILDEIGDGDILGKEPGEDARNNKATYSAVLGLDRARKTAEKLLDDSYKLIKAMPSNEILVEYINLIRERIPL